MRTREKIENQITDLLDRSIAVGSIELLLKAMQPIFLEVILDCRDLLTTLVENTKTEIVDIPHRSSRKIITTEVVLSDKEQEVLKKLDEVQP